MKTKILVGIMFLGLLFPIITLAAVPEPTPEFNTICWRKAACDIQRASLLNKTVKEVEKDFSGWVQNQAPCNQEGWGKCLPSGVTVTEISFGGQKKFNNLGEFLKTNYNMALAVAGILAVIMIIVAGVQWVTSGGNSEMITGAKKRIGGALTGLLIAYLSYTILNTINPALINLSLPQNYMIRPLNELPEFCKDAAPSTTFAFASNKGEKVDPKKFSDPNLKLEEMSPDKMDCGKNYFAGSGEITCKGSFCGKDSGKTCLPLTSDGDKYVSNLSNCESAQIVFHYVMNPSLKQTMVTDIPVVNWFTAIAETGNWLDNTNFVFYSVCSRAGTADLYIGDDGFALLGELWDASDGMSLITVSSTPYNQYYLKINNLDPDVTPHTFETKKWGCLEGDVLKGFVLRSEMGNKAAFTDSNFFVSEGGKAGVWKSISENGYISLESLRQNKIVKVTIEGDVLTDLSDNKGSTPTKFTVDGKAGGESVKK
jgi:hypothetical protein